MLDKETTMAEVHTLAQAARESVAPSTREAGARQSGVGVIAPIHLGTSPVIPERYVVHYSTTVCKNCNTAVRDSEFYALSYLRSRVNGTRVRHLTRCTSPEFNLPVDVIPTGTQYVPFCCECPAIDLSHLPPPPQAALVYDLAEPRLKGQKPRGEPKPPKSQPTADDLA